MLFRSGLTAGATHASTASGSIHTVTAPKVMEISPPVLQITSRELGAGFHAGSGMREPPLFVVPVDVDSGSVIVYNALTGFQQVVRYPDDHGKDISTFELQIRDQHGIPLDTNLDYNLVLSVEAGE